MVDAEEHARVDGAESIQERGDMHDELPCLNLLQATPAILSVSPDDRYAVWARSDNLARSLGSRHSVEPRGAPLPARVRRGRASAPAPAVYRRPAEKCLTANSRYCPQS
jgi:hypothetical protein